MAVAASPGPSSATRGHAAVPKKGGLPAATADAVHASRRRCRCQTPAAHPLFLPPGLAAAGSRGAAFLAAAGISLPSAASPPKLPTKRDSAIKAARQAEAAAPLSSAKRRRNPLVDQSLPKKLSALLDMFGEWVIEQALAPA